mmetsp:Transcript_4631/g.10784  ORF Transcript_4631/g.10784 Transcript_4631/m.10784 type:complete len:265 (+) Transcript_4631:218-1012(+)
MQARVPVPQRVLAESGAWISGNASQPGLPLVALLPALPFLLLQQPRRPREVECWAAWGLLWASGRMGTPMKRLSWRCRMARRRMAFNVLCTAAKFSSPALQRPLRWSSPMRHCFLLDGPSLPSCRRAGWTFPVAAMPWARDASLPHAATSTRFSQLLLQSSSCECRTQPAPGSHLFRFQKTPWSWHISRMRSHGRCSATPKRGAFECFYGQECSSSGCFGVAQPFLRLASPGELWMHLVAPGSKVRRARPHDRSTLRPWASFPS